MDQETKQLLEENLKLSKENNEMLNSLIRSKKQNAIFKAVYWVIIILITIGSYYFIKPYISSLTSLYTGGASEMLNVSVSENQQITDLLNKLK
ncbi:MAG: hypothetical protein JJE53_00080 [Candidatus Pacebacteria bacterium]|nr:hypothetical protein [Candidatus Paceibacterota bacterium]